MIGQNLPLADRPNSGLLVDYTAEALDFGRESASKAGRVVGGRVRHEKRLPARSTAVNGPLYSPTHQPPLRPEADLVREALTLHTRSLAAPDTGTWSGDLQLFAAQLAEFFADPVEVSQNVLMASGAHPDYTSAVLEHYQPIFADWRTMLARAVDRGDIAPNVDFDAILRLLLAPLLLEPLLYRRTLTHRELDDHVTLVLRATAA